MRAAELIDALPRLLIVDADPAICYTLQHILQHYGYDVCITTEREHARTLIASEPFDLLLIAPEVHGPISAAALMLFAAAMQPGAARVLLHDEGSAELDESGAFANAVLDKHACPAVIATGVAQALSKRSASLLAFAVGV